MDLDQILTSLLHPLPPDTDGSWDRALDEIEACFEAGRDLPASVTGHPNWPVAVAKIGPPPGFDKDGTYLPA